MTFDTIEALDNGVVQVRYVEPVLENGDVVGQNFWRASFYPGQDVSNQSEEVRLFCEQVWTDSIIEAYTNQVISYE